MLAVTTAAATVGDPANPQKLAADLAAAYQTGDRDIIISPGTYQIPSTGKDSIVLDRWKDAKVHAAGVVLIFADGRHRPVRLSHCSNVVFEGATLRLATAPDTQGRITAMGTDAKDNWCDWQIDTGYRTDLDLKKKTFNVVDAGTRVLKIQTGDIGITASESPSPGHYRLHFGLHKPQFAVNDWLVTRAGGANALHQRPIRMTLAVPGSITPP